MTDPLVHSFRPYGTARRAFTCQDPEVLLSGPAGTGKSRALMEKLHLLMLKYPGARGLIVRKTATSLTSTALATFKEYVAAEAIRSGEVKFYGGSAGDPAQFRYANGSAIVVAGMDKAQKIMSSEYDVCYAQEAIELSEGDWESITTRLRHGVMPYQQLLADTNPDSPYHWLKQRCDAGKTTIFYCSHEDNPTLFDEESKTWTPAGESYLRRLDGLTGVRLDRLRHGKWSAAEGLVYDEFDASLHLHQPIALPDRNWTRYWSIDFGFENPFVCQFWAQDHDGRLYLYRELYMTHQTVDRHCAAILDLMRTKTGRDVMPRAIVTDHDAEGRATLEEKLGVSTVAARKNVLEGIDAVKSRLRPRQDGTPGLYICREARRKRDPELEAAKKPTCSQEEILSYVWDRSVRLGGNVKDAPLKRDDHGMDAMRYLVAHVDMTGSVGIRFLDSRRQQPRLPSDQGWRRVR